MSDGFDMDDVLKLFYAASSAVQSGEVGEVEFSQDLDDGESTFTVSVRREPAQPTPFNSTTHFHRGEESG